MISNKEKQLDSQMKAMKKLKVNKEVSRSPTKHLRVYLIYQTICKDTKIISKLAHIGSFHYRPSFYINRALFPPPPTNAIFMVCLRQYAWHNSHNTNANVMMWKVDQVMLVNL